MSSFDPDGEAGDMKRKLRGRGFTQQDGECKGPGAEKPGFAGRHTAVCVTEIGEQSGSGSQLRSERRGEATGSFGDPDRWMLLERS